MQQIKHKDSQRNYFQKIMSLKTLLPFLLFAITITTTNAQNATVSGIVKDKMNKTVLPFVNVILKTAKDSIFVSGTVTNEDGLFVLNAIKTGDYVVETSYLGYNTQKISVFVFWRKPKKANTYVYV